MASPWDKLGQAANFMQVAGVDVLGLVSMIVQAAQIARRNRDLCLQLAQHVEIVGGLLGNLHIPELRRYPETRRPLDQLNETLLRTYKLVRSCIQQQANTTLYQMLTGASVADSLRRAQEEIDRYVTLIPMITTAAVVRARARGAPREEAQDDATNDPTPAQRPSLSLQEVPEFLALEGPPPIGTQQPATVFNNIVEEVQRRPERRQRGDPSSFNSSVSKEFTFNQLSSATRGFSLEFKMCNSQLSTWYWGWIGDGHKVAIKRFHFGLRARRFKQEYRSSELGQLAFISSLQHRNLARLVGYCTALNDEVRMLVYDYMKNCSMYDQLQRHTSPVVSSWKLRIKILLHASRGIDYLHSCAVPPLIHGNIRSSNILLDDEWMALVSDFVHPLLEPAVDELRTIGSLDPEYDVLRRLTVKSDVYSFGVVMLEVLTGKNSVFNEVEGARPVMLVNYAVPSIAAGELRKILDPRASELAAHEAQAVQLVASTAVLCVQPEGKDRPVMADIVAKLKTSVALCQGYVPYWNIERDRRREWTTPPPLFQAF